MRVLVLLTMMSGLVLQGCASPTPLPTYAPLSPRETLDAVARSVASVHSMRARCEITCTDTAGSTIHLDGAVAALFPDRLRLQAWKFDRVVMDLTFVRPDAWLVQRSGSSHEQADKISVTGRQLSDALAILTSDFWAMAEPLDDFGTPRQIVARAVLGDDPVLCRIDRPTLTPVCIEADPQGGTTQMSVQLSDFELIGTTVWPRRIEVRSARGTIIVEMREIDLNSPIDPALFTPPQSAVQLP